jgi:hypothetical protein
MSLTTFPRFRESPFHFVLDGATDHRFGPLFELAGDVLADASACLVLPSLLVFFCHLPPTDFRARPQFGELVAGQHSVGDDLVSYRVEDANVAITAGGHRYLEPAALPLAADAKRQLVVHAAAGRGARQRRTLIPAQHFAQMRGFGRERGRWPFDDPDDCYVLVFDDIFTAGIPSAALP